MVEKKILALGIRSKVRQAKSGGDYITDEGNLILDCECGEIPDPDALAASIRAMVGVVEHGLFLNMAEMALVADGAEVKTIYK